MGNGSSSTVEVLTHKPNSKPNFRIRNNVGKTEVTIFLTRHVFNYVREVIVRHSLTGHGYEDYEHRHGARSIYRVYLRRSLIVVVVTLRVTKRTVTTHGN